jgi:hypothetical protein
MLEVVSITVVQLSRKVISVCFIINQKSRMGETRESGRRSEYRKKGGSQTAARE